MNRFSVRQTLARYGVGLVLLALVQADPAAMANVLCPENKRVDCNDRWQFDEPKGTNLFITVLDTTTNVLCGSSYVALRTWQIIDDQSGSLVCTQRVTVEADLDIDCARDKTIACGQSWDFDEPDVDSCDDDVDVDIVYTTTTSLPDGSVQHTRKWRVRDACGNEDTCKQVVTVLSPVPPVVHCAPNKVVEGGSAWDFDAPSAVNSLGSPLPFTLLGTSTNGDCGGTFTASRLWEFVDLCGNRVQCSQHVTLVDTHAPVLLNCPTNLVLECVAIPPPSRVGAADPVLAGPGPQLLLNSNNIVGGSGSWSGMPWNAADNGFNAFRIVDNQTGPIFETAPGNFWLGRDEHPTEYIVIDLGKPVLIDRIDLFNTHNEVLNDRQTRDFQITAGHAALHTGANGLDLAGPVDLILSNRLSIHLAEQDPIEPDTFTAENGLAPCAAYRYLRFEALHGYGYDHVGLSEIRIFARVVCDPDVPVLFRETRIPGACPQSYTLTRTWTVIDDCGNSNQCAQTITVLDTTSPILVCPPDRAWPSLAEVPAIPADLAAFVAVGGRASDACDANLTYRCTDGPPVPSACGKVIERRHSVTDGCGNSAQCVQVLRIEESMPPVLVPLANRSLCDGDVAIFAPRPVGDGPFQFVWRHNGSLLPGETNSFLTVLAADFATLGLYSVEVAGPCGGAFSSAILSPAEPVAVAPLGDQVKNIGEGATFATITSGTSPFSFVWRHDGELLAGESGNSLTLPSVSAADAGTYTVEVRGPCNSVTNGATLTVLAPEPFADFLLSHWKLDETNGLTARDAIAANHGNLLEGPVHCAGLMGGALSLDGLDDCIEIPHAVSLNLSNRFSISLWFRPAQKLDAASGRRELLNKVMSYGLILNAATNDGRLVFALNGGAPAVKSATATWASTGWSHVVCVHDGSNLRLYVNGVQEDAAPATIAPRVIGYPLLFGGDPEQGGYFAGTLDDVRLYSTNLPPTAITALFERSGAARSVPTGLSLAVHPETERVILRWTAVAGTRYRVEFKTDLDALEWTALPREILAVGPAASKVDAFGTPRRFYRVVALP